MSWTEDLVTKTKWFYEYSIDIKNRNKSDMRRKIKRLKPRTNCASAICVF